MMINKLDAIVLGLSSFVGEYFYLTLNFIPAISISIPARHTNKTLFTDSTFRLSRHPLKNLLIHLGDLFKNNSMIAFSRLVSLHLKK